MEPLMKQPPKIAEIYSQTMSKIKLMSKVKKIIFLTSDVTLGQVYIGHRAIFPITYNYITIDRSANKSLKETRKPNAIP